MGLSNSVLINEGSDTIDIEMSDSSTNAVQNKVIKAYIDTAIDETIGEALALIIGGANNE